MTHSFKSEQTDSSRTEVIASRRWIVVGTPHTASQVGIQMSAPGDGERGSERLPGQESQGLGSSCLCGQVLTDPFAASDPVAGPILGSVAELPSILASTLPSTLTGGGGGEQNPEGPVPDRTDSVRLADESSPELGVIVCLPVAMAGALKAVVDQCAAAGVLCRKVPALADVLDGRVSVRPGAPVDATGDLTSLIGRAPRPVDRQVLDETLSGRTVMITGAGGSIGSELARQIAELKPARLLLVERGENPLFEIDREIATRFPALPRQAILHDVTQADATIEMCLRHLPEVVFHAAAHKHVPMMEEHPAAAVENNFYGTRSIVDAATAAEAERFVMISTDKAVNPSSVMGATKRLAELYVAGLDQRLRREGQKTICSMVRFGNVLGSACSVLPIWTKQIARGGPITVTDERMTRYFMTIPEAASLVMQAGATATGGEVFLLDMGEPVRILDLARRFLSAQGLEPDRDVRIQITGARPGEKLFEELAYGSEDMLPTPHEAIRIWSAASEDAGRVRDICQTFDRMRTKAGSDTPWSGVTAESVVAALRASVPEMVRAVA